MFKTLKEVLDLLRGHYTVDNQPVPAPAGPSFLEVVSSHKHPHPYLPPNMIDEIETAVHNKADTHSLLLRIKARFEEEKQLEGTSVQSVMSELGKVLRDV